jgi:hypothetical protein
MQFTCRASWRPRPIADLYKERWQIEIFFRWIKQNLKIKAFTGNSETAVMTQSMRPSSSIFCSVMKSSKFKVQSSKLMKSMYRALMIKSPPLFMLCGWASGP